jgi:hypothetical protein
MKWYVIVGNVGTVLEAFDGAMAIAAFKHWRTSSIEGFGRAAGEQVTLMRDDEIQMEHQPEEELE